MTDCDEWVDFPKSHCSILFGLRSLLFIPYRRRSRVIGEWNGIDFAFVISVKF